MTTSADTNQTEISNTVSSSPQMLSFLKIVEYLSIAAFVGAGILTRVFPDNQLIFILGSVFLSSFIFLFLTNRQLDQKSRNSANQLEIRRKAELYNYLLNPDNVSDNNPITPVREKALLYCQELIDDYKKTRETSRNIYYTFQLATVVLSGVTPILVLVDKLEPGQSLLKWLPVICPAVASIVASIVTSFPFQENWIAANTTVELLEAEQEKFVLGVTPAYRCYDVADEAQYQQMKKMAIENFINQVNEIHLKQIQKPDDTASKEQNTEPAQSTESQQQQS
ncbi:hypothetical protein Osc7112_2515 [Oscillatoria nigro-viridis PCC 7112]|uniref:DUF4231 domain-containing protein n=2 Tax=Phormidium nigroviride TaxID=482564 RepID=K9VG59_9CYAN|nr:DUF4231 domain-containing protein [Oscillatoria nigro-viridis]AFZ06946.1 hypothetical protein Osc7112_2515 [Oscillatoria nigro-viridis PCC 7112]